jgi:protein ImuB
MTTRRLLSLALPHLAAEAARKRLGRGLAAATPVATLVMVRGAARLAALCPRAIALGLREGMALADARALRPELIAFEVAAGENAARLAAIADWCRRWTPLAAVDSECGAPAVTLDVGGAAHLFGGEEKLAREVETAFRAQGFSARACVAASPQAARALARFTALALAPQGRAFERLADSLPLAALELDAETLDAMRQAGFRRVGDVRLRPRAPLAARFGPHVLTRLDGLFGLTLSPISPRFETPPYLVERRFAEPLTQEDAIQATLARLCEDLCAMLTRHGEGARRLDASFFRVDGVTRRLVVGAAQATRDPRALARLFRERLKAIGEEGLDTGYGFDVVRLAAARVERLDADQAILGASAKAGDFAHLVDRLGARLGPHRVTRLVARARRLPEQAGALAPHGQEQERQGRGQERGQGRGRSGVVARRFSGQDDARTPQDLGRNAPPPQGAGRSDAMASHGQERSDAMASHGQERSDGLASRGQERSDGLASRGQERSDGLASRGQERSDGLASAGRAGALTPRIPEQGDGLTSRGHGQGDALAPYAPGSGDASARRVPDQADALAASGAGAGPDDDVAPPRLDTLPSRPLRVFDPPEPVEALAEAPDGPPLRFRWRRVLHEVAAAEGPERIACDWRRGDAPTRDYYRVEDRQGRRFWLYREGLLGRETGRARWFAHGLFA